MPDDEEMSCGCRIAHEKLSGVPNIDTAEGSIGAGPPGRLLPHQCAVMNKQSQLASEANPFDDAWRQQAVHSLDEEGRKLVEEAVQWAQEGLTGRHAGTGEPLTSHAAGVVKILAEIGADPRARPRAILTMLPSGNGKGTADLERLRKAFGPAVATLVQGTRVLLRLGWFAGTAPAERGPQGQDQKEMRRKMLLAMAADLRIVCCVWHRVCNPCAGMRPPKRLTRSKPHAKPWSS